MLLADVVEQNTRTTASAAGGCRRVGRHYAAIEHQPHVLGVAPAARFGGYAPPRDHRQHRSDEAAENSGSPHGPLQVVQAHAPGDFDYQEHLGAVVAPPATHHDIGQPDLLPVIFGDDPALQARVEQSIEFPLGVSPGSPELRK